MPDFSFLTLKGATNNERRTKQRAGSRRPGMLWYYDLLLRMLLPAGLLPACLLPTSRRKAAGACQRKVLLKIMDDTANLAGQVWHTLSDDLRAFLRSRIPTDSDTDDLLQDVFVRVIEKIGSLRQADRIDSWVYQIARNAIADFYRKRTPRPAHAVEVVFDPVKEAASNQNRAVGAWLSLMMEGLPKTLQDAVRMYEIDGLSQSEIANRLSISLSGAKSRVQRGRRQLEELLRGCCQLELDRRGNIIGCKPASIDCCAEASCGCNDKSS